MSFISIKGPVTVLVLLFAVFLGTTGGRHSSNVIDLEPIYNDDFIDSLCNGEEDNKQLSRLSTITWLKGNLLSVVTQQVLPADQMNCLMDYLEPVEDLYSLMTTASENMCSMDKVVLYERFHRKYIAKTLRYHYDGPSKPIPQPLRLFFMRYAAEFTQTCEEILLETLAEAADERMHVDYNVIFADSFGKLDKGMRYFFGNPGAIKDLDDFMLMWNLVDDQARSRGEPEPQVKFDKSTGEMVRLTLEVKNAALMVKAQEECRNNLRPVYEKNVLPVMRLIDLGYRSTQKWTNFQEFRANSMFQNWYSIAQVCELLLPVKLISNKNLQNGEIFVIEDEKSEGSALPPKAGSLRQDPYEFRRIDSVDSTPRDDDDDVLPNIATETDYQLIKRVRANGRSRRNNSKKIMKLLSMVMKESAMNKLKNTFVTRKVGGKYERQNLGPESMVDAEVWQTEEDEETDEKDFELQETDKKKKSSAFKQFLKRQFNKHPFIWSCVGIVVFFFGFILLVGSIG